MFLPEAFAYQAIPNNRVAPNLAKRNITMERVAIPDVTVSYFNMDDPIVGGYTPDKVALRRAIALAYNSEEEIRLPRRNQAILAQGPMQPSTYGYDPKFKTEMSMFDRARAGALLDMFGYVDKDGDGWRDMPDGKPLLLEYATTPTARDRELNEIWKKNMNAVGINIAFKTGKWPEHLKAARAGKLMIWGLGLSAIHARRLRRHWFGLWSCQGRGQPVAVSDGRVRQAVRPVTIGDARWPRAPGHDAKAGQDHGGLHALQVQHPPHPHRLDAAMVAGIPQASGQPRILEVCRYRPEQAAQVGKQTVAPASAGRGQ
ncbi:MAG: hypothetical protein IPO43_22800 [Rhodoferax sp.]|nr:hypothetical protein [Rhodoferax sp.]